MYMRHREHTCVMGGQRERESEADFKLSVEPDGLDLTS